MVQSSTTTDEPNAHQQLLHIETQLNEESYRPPFLRKLKASLSEQQHFYQAE